jgi:hypothetical protein
MLRENGRTCNVARRRIPSITGLTRRAAALGSNVAAQGRSISGLPGKRAAALRADWAPVIAHLDGVG